MNSTSGGATGAKVAGGLRRNPADVPKVKKSLSSATLVFAGGPHKAWEVPAGFSHSNSPRTTRPPIKMLVRAASLIFLWLPSSPLQPANPPPSPPKHIQIRQQRELNSRWPLMSEKRPRCFKPPCRWCMRQKISHPRCPLLPPTAHSSVKAVIERPPQEKTS